MIRKEMKKEIDKTKFSDRQNDQILIFRISSHFQLNSIDFHQACKKKNFNPGKNEKYSGEPVKTL